LKNIQADPLALVCQVPSTLSYETLGKEMVCRS